MMILSHQWPLMLSIVCLSECFSLSNAFVTRESHNLVAGARSPGPAVSKSALHSFGDFRGITEFFKPKQQESATPIKPKFDDVVIDPDYRVGAVFLVLGGALDTVPFLQIWLGPFITLLGVLFLVQASRVRFVFDGDSIELLNKGEQAGELKSSGENVVVGGANRWRTDTIVNYDFFPKGWIDGPIGPILIYFKETQTDSTTWTEGPGAKANDPESIAAGNAVAGQVHFFPAICNAQQIRGEFQKRGCGKITDS
ncbi:hypothetical protein MPSEU_000482300 [Mayamaea pseudoterrestris]|nr:hypothetical protein MPSEU_000482300 [Mayamaea pseudoterrestris]